MNVAIFQLLLFWSTASNSDSDNVNSVNDDTLFNYYSTDYLHSGLDELAIRIQGGPSVADKLAKQYGYINHGEVRFIRINLI